MKKSLVLLLVLAMLTTLCSCDRNPNKIEGKGYDSPEEAILAYAEALQKGDVDAILATFAVETHVSNFDFEKYLERVRVYSSYSTYVLDSTDDFTQSMNVINRQYQISKSLTDLYLSMGDLEDYTTPMSITGNPYSSADDLLDDLVIDDWMEILAGMEIGEVLELSDFPRSYGLDNSKDFLKKSNKATAKYLGCDEVVSLAVEITIDGDDYYLCVDVACYDGKWYNSTPCGHLALLMGAPTYCGGLVPAE